ncbi:MAG: hypothetical protein GQ535_03805 [Rhodobacteraceae bacterium]|nr:hypothetical protein [Paracoccaceae bacterium]
MEAWIGPAIIATIFSAVFSVLRENHFSGKRRHERVQDIQIALLAEIRAYVAVLLRDKLDEFEATMIKRMVDDLTFVPFILREKNDMVFKSILPDIHVLPESSIDPVVVYYSQIVAIAEMAHDMRSNVFAELSVDRRIDIYSNFIAMKKEAVILGKEAECMLDTHITSGKEGVSRFLRDRNAKEMGELRAQVKGWLNSQASDLSGHQ